MNSAFLKRSLTRILLCLKIVCFLTSATASAQLAVCYRVTELGTSNLVEAIPAGVHAGFITDSGLMTGIIYYTNKPNSMLYYSPDTGFVDLGRWNDRPTRGLDINESGQIAVQIGDNEKAMRYTPGVGFEEIGSLGGTDSEATHTASHINEAGEIAGISSTPNGEEHAFFWTPETGMHDLGTLGGRFSRANGLNDYGWIAGASRIDDDSFHGFLYRPGQGMTDLGPGVAGGPNNQGVSSGFDGSGWPMLFYDGKRVRIRTPWGRGQYSLSSVNEHNLFVGTFFDENLSRTFWAMAGSEVYGVVKLDSLIPPNSEWQLVFANGLNNNCQIVGEGVHQGRSAIFRLDPIIPPLSIRHANTNIVLSWTEAFFPLEVEESATLEDASWQSVGGVSTNALILPMVPASRFYRLAIPPPPPPLL